MPAENSNARWVLAPALGVVVGLGLGWLLFSAGEGEQRAAGVSIERGAAGPEARHARGPVPAFQPERAERRAARADTGPVARNVSADELDALAAEADAPRVERAKGVGVISGHVTDPDGHGVPDVLLRAVREDETAWSFSPTIVGAGPPPLDDLRAVVREAAREHAELLARTYETLSDASGGYRFEELPDGGYRVGGYKAGYLVGVAEDGSSYVEPDAGLDLLARPVLRLPIRLTLPDGGAPAAAAVVVTAPDERQGTSYSWSPDAPELRLTPGTYEVVALGERVELPEGQPPSSLRSQMETVELESGTAPAELVLVLRERLGVRGHISFPDDGVRGGRTFVRLLPLGPAGEPDLTRLAEARRPEFLRGDGDYAFLDLEPGRYAVGVTRGSGELCAHAVVELTDGIVVQDFELSPLDRSRYVAARVLDARGVAVGEAEFRFVHAWGWRNDMRWVTPLRGPEGLHLVPIPADYLEDYRAGTSEHAFSLSVTARGRGTAVVALEPGQAEVVVRLAEAARLALTVPGATAEPVVGRLSVELERSDVAARGTSAEVGVDGACTMEGLAPGAYTLTLRVSDRRGTSSSALIRIAALELSLASGPNRASLPVPTLHPVSVRYLGEPEGVHATIGPAEEVRGPLDSVGWDGLELDAKGHAGFEHVPAGRYTVRIVKGTEELSRRDIDVPCGEVALSPDR